MNKLIILLLAVMFLVSCNDNLNNNGAFRTEGIIDKIEAYTDTTVAATILFYYRAGSTHDHIVFILPDTVRVGQHYKLKPL